MRTLRIAVLAFVASACQDEIGSCIPGTAGCICDGSNSCEPGVVCVANLCEPLDESPPVAEGGESTSGFDGRTSDDGGTSTGPLERAT
jgi:hypothetical protein